MPKPFILHRRTGRYVRFLVPHDLRAAIGQRFIVRRLRDTDPDAARLAAARMGAALCRLFERLREGYTVADYDIKGLLEKNCRGELRELTIGHAVGKDGTQYHNIQINNPLDAELFHQIKEGRSVKVSVPGIGETFNLPAAPLPPAPPPASDKPLLSAAIADYKREREGKRDSSGEMDVANVLDIFLTLTGDLRLHLVNRDHIREFEELVKVWPSNAKKKAQFKGMNNAQILKMVHRNRRQDKPAYKLLSDRSRSKYHDILAAFFNHQVANDILVKSPMGKGFRLPEHRVQKTQTRRPFTADELKKIFAPETFLPWAAGKPHHFWAPWLALYSGVRLNEVAQLYADDVETIVGIPGFHVRAGRPDQHVKTGSSFRFIPLAQTVLDAGFLQYVEDVKAAKHARLLPHLKYTGRDYGDYLGDRFGVYLVNIGLKASADAPEAEKEQTAGMGMHFFRHGASTSLVHQGTTINTTTAITGHGRESVMPGELPRYVDVATLPQRLAALNSLDFPKLPRTYTAGMFAEELESAHALAAKWKREDAKRAERKAKERREKTRASATLNDD